MQRDPLADEGEDDDVKQKKADVDPPLSVSRHLSERVGRTPDEMLRSGIRQERVGDEEEMVDVIRKGFRRFRGENDFPRGVESDDGHNYPKGFLWALDPAQDRRTAIRRDRRGTLVLARTRSGRRRERTGRVVEAWLVSQREEVVILWIRRLPHVSKNFLDRGRATTPRHYRIRCRHLSHC